MNFIISEIRPGSCPECEHCHEVTEVSEFLKERERLRELVIQEAKNFFGSIERDERKDTIELIKVVGELLVHENHC